MQIVLLQKETKFEEQSRINGFTYSYFMHLSGYHLSSVRISTVQQLEARKCGREEAYRAPEDRHQCSPRNLTYDSETLVHVLAFRVYVIFPIDILASRKKTGIKLH